MPGRQPGQGRSPGIGRRRTGNSPRAHPALRLTVTGDVILLLVLMVPIGLWLAVRWLPEQRRKQAPRLPPPGREAVVAALGPGLPPWRTDGRGHVEHW